MPPHPLLRNKPSTTESRKTNFLWDRSSKPLSESTCDVQRGRGQSGSFYNIYQSNHGFSPRKRDKQRLSLKTSEVERQSGLIPFPNREIKWKKTHVHPSIYFSTTILISFNMFYDLFMSLKNIDQKKSRQPLLFFSQCVSGWYPTNPAMWLVPRARGILP